LELKDWLNSINLNKQDLTEDDPEVIKKYAPFIINKCMGGHMDTVMLANEMNISHGLDKYLQYKFYLNIVRKRKRFSPWLKKDKIKDLELVKKYYNYSNSKAEQALKILTKDQLEYIRLKFDTGGVK
jgi:hypothetical protein